MYNIKFVA